MANIRAKNLWKTVSDNTNWSRDEARLLQAIAVMLAEATKKPSKARKKIEVPLPFGPGDVHKTLLESCSEHVNVGTYDSASFGRLGKTMSRVSDLCIADLGYLEGWICDGGVEFWQEKPTWTHVIKHFVDWVAQAREWAAEYEGSRALGSNVR